MGYASEHPTHDVDDHEHIAGLIVSSETELLDPMVALAAVAGATTYIRLATGVYILPLRHPLMTAQATLYEALLALGVGAGWLEEEFAALDVPFDGRASRVTESIDVLAAWRGGPFEHHGTHFSFGPVQEGRRLVGVPIIMGGNTPAALRRAGALGDGWFSSGTLTIDVAVGLFAAIRRLRSDLGLAGAPYRCYFRVPGHDPELLALRRGRDRGHRGVGRSALAGHGQPGIEAEGFRRGRLGHGPHTELAPEPGAIEDGGGPADLPGHQLALVGHALVGRFTAT